MWVAVYCDHHFTYLWAPACTVAEKAGRTGLPCGQGCPVVFWTEETLAVKRMGHSEDTSGQTGSAEHLVL